MIHSDNKKKEKKKKKKHKPPFVSQSCQLSDELPGHILSYSSQSVPLLMEMFGPVRVSEEDMA